MYILKKLFVGATTMYSLYSGYMLLNGSKPPADFNTFLIQQMSALNVSEILQSLNALNLISDPNASLMQQISSLNTSQVLQSLDVLLENIKEEEYSSKKIIKEAKEGLKNIGVFKDELNRVMNMTQKGNYRDALRSMTEFLSNAMQLTKIEVIRVLQSTEAPKTPEQILSNLEVTAESLKNLIKLEEEKILQSQEKIKNLTETLQRFEEQNSQSQSFAGKVLEQRNQQQPSNNLDL